MTQTETQKPLNLERIQGRVGTPYHPADTGNIFVRASEGLPAHAAGDRMLADTVIPRYFRGENGVRLDSMTKTLLWSENGTPLPARNETLSVLYDIASEISTYGVGVKKFYTNIAQEGYLPVRLPAIDSAILIEQGVVTDKDQIEQIKARREQLTQRYGNIIGSEVSSENWLIMKILSDAEKDLFQEPSLENRKPYQPVIFIQEHYTITLPRLPQYDVDTVGHYLLLETPEGIQLLFLGEEQKPPHYHYYNEGKERWEQVEYNDLGPKRLEELKGVTIPEPTPPRDDFKATNKQLAKLLVFFRYSTTKSKPIM